MSETVLLIEECPGSARALLEESGYRVESATPADAIGRAHDVTPDVMVFLGGGTTRVARTLGWVHDVPMLFVGAERAALGEVPRSRRIVPSPECLPAVVRVALADR
ncbi:MAG: hypothetical protein HYY16_03670 [Planctomycetes bacterium]|nr:hypothetical protein [Planctomycetota bacterium]